MSRLLGIFLGLTIAGIVLAFVKPQGPAPLAGPIVSECSGSIRAVSVQYVAGASYALPVYRDLLPHLDAVVRVYVTCPEPADFDEFTRGVGPVNCTIIPVYTHHLQSAWARDRFLVLSPLGSGKPTVLLRPAGEAGAAIWPQRAGDERVAGDLAAALGPAGAVVHSPLYFDGGDVTADDETAFVTPAVAKRNLQQTVPDLGVLQTTLSRLLQRRIVLLDPAPDHHALMFMAPIGNRTVLVGDPAAGAALLSLADRASATVTRLPGGPDVSLATQQRFDAVAQQVQSAGYRVVRIPVVPATDGKTFLTYVNVLMEIRDGKKIVYMPVFDGVDALNDSAEKVWRAQGFTVIRINCTTTYTLFGNLHCLVNVIERG